MDGLQWVHGPITVVMPRGLDGTQRRCPASMGPRSDNGGYAVMQLMAVICHGYSFNGSTVG